MFSFTKDIGMDLGTASVLIYIKDKGIVLNEPSVVALDKNTGKLLKVGADAQAMLGRTPGNIIAIRPLREGVISDYEVTERMIKEFLHKVMGFQLFKPRIIICVPSGITEVEERAVIDAGIQAGARRVYLIEEPVAAAIGAGIDITQPEGHMIIDIGIVLNEPSVVALDKNTGKLLKVGADAQAMLGRTPGNIIAIRPLREGVISDYEVTERMIKEFLHKVMGFQLFKPRIIICVPSGITEVEERAVIDAGIQAGARRVYLIEEPVAAAIGAGIDITQPEGHMIIDIGGGTSDIAVISLSGVVESSSIKIAGDQFNEAVVKYMRRKHNLLVGERTAEQMKMQIGCVFPPEEEMTMEVKGRSLITGLPELISVSSAEMLEAFEEPVERIMEEVHLVLEKTPPELVADISNNGIVMTGGGSLVRGFDKLVTARTGIHAMVAENAIQCVAEGTGRSLDSIQDMQDGTMNLSRRKQIN